MRCLRNTAMQLAKEELHRHIVTAQRACRPECLVTLPLPAPMEPRLQMIPGPACASASHNSAHSPRMHHSTGKIAVAGWSLVQASSHPCECSRTHECSSDLRQDAHNALRALYNIVTYPQTRCIELLRSPRCRGVPTLPAETPQTPELRPQSLLGLPNALAADTRD